MIKTILAHLAGTDCDKAVLAAGLQIARPFGAHIDCLRLIPDSAALIAQAAQVDMGTWTVLPDAIAALEQGGRERTERARHTLAEFCAAEHIARADAPPGPGTVSAAAHEEVGDEFDHITARARFYDLVVLAGGSERTGRLPEEALGSILIESGRPILLAPQNPRTGPIKTIAIAWKDTAEAARAISVAMPLLAKAAQIAVLSADEQDRKSGQLLESSEHIARQLRWHGFDAKAHFVTCAGRAIPNAILDAARNCDADLLVMGGYGHSRLREIVFGGFTQRILRGADLPVFVFH